MGDFQPIDNFDSPEIIIFFIGSIILTLVMMSVIIALIGDTNERVMATKEKCQYF